jgi:hypothetical protein
MRAPSDMRDAARGGRDAAAAGDAQLVGAAGGVRVQRVHLLDGAEPGVARRRGVRAREDLPALQAAVPAVELLRDDHGVAGEEPAAVGLGEQRVVVAEARREGQVRRRRVLAARRRRLGRGLRLGLYTRARAIYEGALSYLQGFSV